MIKMQNLVPKVYFKQSRDFQFISRLYELVLNSIKTNSDLIYLLSDISNTDDNFLELLSTTLGFQSFHNYNVSQLRSLCSCFVEVIKTKGSIRSIEKACNALVGAEGITEGVYIDSSNPKKELVLYVSQELSDINLLRDLMNYILPAGLSYSIVKTLKVSESMTTKVNVKDNFAYAVHHASTTSIIKSSYAQEETAQVAKLDASGTLINSTVVDSYGYGHNITAVETMDIADGNLIGTYPITQINGHISVPLALFPAGESATFTITCNSGYKLVTTNYLSVTSDSAGIWFKKPNSTEIAFNMNPSNITVTTSTDQPNVYTVTIISMPDYDLDVIAQIDR